jgi:hypothetical protein
VEPLLRRRVKSGITGIGQRIFAGALDLDSPAKGRPYGEVF